LRSYFSLKSLQLLTPIFHIFLGYSLEDGKFKEGGQVSEIKALLENGARPMYKNNEGHGAIHEAAARGQIEIMNLILTKFPEVLDQKSSSSRRSYNTPLTMAIMNDRKEAVQLLILKVFYRPELL